MFVILAATNATASAAPTAAAKTAVKFDHLNLIFNVDVFILCLTGLFILLCLPRLVIRFIHPEEWYNGHWLRYVYVHNPVQSYPTVAPPTPAHLSTSPRKVEYYDSRSEKSVNFDDDEYERQGADLHRNASTNSQHALLSRNASTGSQHALLSRNASTASSRVRRRRETLPVHMPAWSSMAPWFSNVLRITISPGLTVGRVILMLTYFFILLYASLYQSNIFTNSIRTGFVAASQIPVVVTLGTKNNLLGIAVGMGYERVSLFLFSFLSPPMPSMCVSRCASTYGMLFSTAELLDKLCSLYGRLLLLL